MFRTATAISVIGFIAVATATSVFVPRWMDADVYGKANIYGFSWTEPTISEAVAQFSWDLNQNCARQLVNSTSEGEWFESLVCNNTITIVSSTGYSSTENTTVDLEAELNSVIDNFSINLGHGFENPLT